MSDQKKSNLPPLRQTERCAFVSPDGTNCPITTLLEHYEPRWGRAFPAHTPRMVAIREE